MAYTGTLNGSTFPLFPSTSGATTYLVTAAGKVGGILGRTVNKGDVLATAAASDAGTELEVGMNWTKTAATESTEFGAELNQLDIVAVDADRDTTGTGNVVLATSPTLVTPVLGTATITKLNTMTVPSSGAIVNCNKDLTFSSSGVSTLTVPTSGTVPSALHALSFMTTGTTTLTVPATGTLGLGFSTLTINASSIAVLNGAPLGVSTLSCLWASGFLINGTSVAVPYWPLV